MKHPEMKKYRNNGAIGALLDEYEKAIFELQAILTTVNNSELVENADPDTEDPECRSIQTVLSHVVESAYTYAISIQNSQGKNLPYRTIDLQNTCEEYHQAISAVFAYTEQVFNDFPSIKLEEYSEDKKILMRWGQHYDPEQLMEHAIVHILRHRRQIEKFLARIK